ncbi:MAG TPA: RNA-binding protein [Candidatus Acidoferrales bacterium]|nr:RNA-binding protein [Candidatus Acidoferrales bacterium]
MAIKRRHFLKTDVAQRIVAALSAYDVKKPLKGALELLETAEQTLILLNGVPVALCIDHAPFFTVRGAMELEPQRHLVTVDMGAVQFIRNGADVMSPGIIHADEDIRPQDFVVVIDERYKKPLGVGVALITGSEMIRHTKGKAVRILHHVGDKIWHASP